MFVCTRLIVLLCRKDYGTSMEVIDDWKHTFIHLQVYFNFVKLRVSTKLWRNVDSTFTGCCFSTVFTFSFLSTQFYHKSYCYTTELKLHYNVLRSITRVELYPSRKFLDLFYPDRIEESEEDVGPRLKTGIVVSCS